MGLPVAWSMQEKGSTPPIIMFLMRVKACCLKMNPNWRPSCFIIDCCDAEKNALEKVFPGIPIYF
jgi:hypothetical protein